MRARTTAYEGQHGVDELFFGPPVNHAERYVLEDKAYMTESYVNEATNTTSPYCSWHSGWQESAETNTWRANSDAANAHIEAYESDKADGQ